MAQRTNPKTSKTQNQNHYMPPSAPPETPVNYPSSTDFSTDNNGVATRNIPRTPNLNNNGKDDSVLASPSVPDDASELKDDFEPVKVNTDNYRRKKSFFRSLLAYPCKAKKKNPDAADLPFMSKAELVPRKKNLFGKVFFEPDSPRYQGSLFGIVFFEAEERKETKEQDL